MDQRAPRLGDIVDDYCPRERRITNHAIVAIVEDAIRQTRCTACDTEHEFKDGREPRKRKASDTAFDQVLANVTGERVVTRPAPSTLPSVPAVAVPSAAPSTPPAPAAAAVEPERQPQVEEAWSAHRRLIRASLPRTENDIPAPRPIPEFTMHQRPTGRQGRFGRPGQEVDGNVFHQHHANGLSNGTGRRNDRRAHGGHTNGSGNGASNGHRQGGQGGNGGGHGRGRPGRGRGSSGHQ